MQTEGSNAGHSNLLTNGVVFVCNKHLDTKAAGTKGNGGPNGLYEKDICQQTKWLVHPLITLFVFFADFFDTHAK